MDGEPVLSIEFGDADYVELGDYTEVQKSVMPVLARNRDGVWEAVGTAFTVSEDGLMVTADHVLSDYFDGIRDGTETVAVLFETDDPVVDGAGEPCLGATGNPFTTGGLLRVVDAFSIDSADLAIIRVAAIEVEGEPYRFPTVRLSAAIPTVGDVGIAFGYPNFQVTKPEDDPDALDVDRALIASKGSVKAVHVEQRDRWLVHYPAMQLDAQLPGGTSGGPIWSVEHGTIVGVVSSGFNLGAEEADGSPVSYGSLTAPLYSYPVPPVDPRQPVNLDYHVSHAIADGTINGVEADEQYDFVETEYGPRLHFRG